MLGLTPTLIGWPVVYALHVRYRSSAADASLSYRHAYSRTPPSRRRRPHERRFPSRSVGADARLGASTIAVSPTGAFIGGYPLESSSGLNRQSIIYDDAFLNTPGVTERRADDVVRAAGSWIEAHRARPFFRLALYLSIPFALHPARRVRRSASGAPYDGEIA